MSIRTFILIGFAGALSVGLLGCGKNGSETSAGGGSVGKMQTVKINIDGSSTVFPISQAIAEDYMAANPNVDITVSEAGTGGGMKKFVRGEIDICDASRPIEPEEIEMAKKNGIEFIELPVAFDGLTVVVHKDNNFAKNLTVDELKRIWETGSKINNWSQVRPGFPNQPLKLFGPGTDSGTFEYFTEAIVKKKRASRSDYTASEDDNVLAQGVAGDKNALGYFGYAYFDANRDKISAVSIDGVPPTPETITNGTYMPLSRPLFIYISLKALEKPGVAEFVEYYIANAPRLVEEVKYIKLSDEAYKLIADRFAKRTKGSIFQEGSWVGMKPEDILNKESQ